MSSQLVTIPCSMGYFKVKIPRLDWASETGQRNSPFSRHTITDVGVLLTHADHDTLMARTTDDGGEDLVEEGRKRDGESRYRKREPVRMGVTMGETSRHTYSSRSVVSSETSLAHAGAVINDQLEGGCGHRWRERGEEGERENAECATWNSGKKPMETAVRKLCLER